MSPNAFGQYVRQLRTALDMTQAALADRVGCALVTLKKLESGQRRPSRQIAVRLALALQIPPDDHPRFVRLARRRSSPHLCANPYRGLAPFDEHDRELFFGRESLTDTLTGQLRKIGRDGGPRFLAVIGPSGSGKSSLVRAGLLPDLRDGALPGSEAWPIAVVTPGADPIASLDQALAQSSHSRKRSGRLLVIDQFEEVFTLCADESVHATFLQQVIDTATAADQTWVVITLRADFFDQPLRHRAFGTLLCAHAQYVLPLTPAEIERAVIGPAEVVGVAVESALVATLVAEVDARLGALPLLQYVLTELFEQRSGQPLTLQAYHAVSSSCQVALGQVW